MQKSDDSFEYVGINIVEAFLSKLEDFGPKITGPSQHIAVQELDQSYVQITNAIKIGNSYAATTDMSLRITVFMGPYWMLRGLLSEGINHLARTGMSQPSSDNALLFAEALNWLGRFRSGTATTKRDYEESRTYNERSLELFRQGNDKRGTATALDHLCVLNNRLHRRDIAKTCIEESLGIWKELNEAAHIADSLCHLGVLLRWDNDFHGALRLFEESVRFAKKAKDRHMTAEALNNVGLTAYYLRDYAHSESALHKAARIRQSLRDERGLSLSLNNIGRLQCKLGDFSHALVSFRRSLELKHNGGNVRGVAFALEGLSATLSGLGDFYNSAILLGAAATIRERLASPLPPNEEAEYEHYATITRDALGVATFSQTLAAGRALTYEDVIELGLRAPIEGLSGSA